MFIGIKAQLRLHGQVLSKNIRTILPEQRDRKENAVQPEPQANRTQFGAHGVEEADDKDQKEQDFFGLGSELLRHSGSQFVEQVLKNQGVEQILNVAVDVHLLSLLFIVEFGVDLVAKMGDLVKTLLLERENVGGFDNHFVLTAIDMQAIAMFLNRVHNLLFAFMTAERDGQAIGER